MTFSSYLSSLNHFVRERYPKFKWQHRCMMCAEPSGTRVCQACETYWPLQTHHCQSCSLPLAHHALHCGDCLKQPPIFDQAYAPYIYASPLNKLIVQFKNQQNLIIGMALCDYWQRRVKQYYQAQHIALPDYLAPVPSHWRRQWQRGFSHTHFCAEQLSQYFSIPLLHQTHMTRHTHMQKSLNRKQRLQGSASPFVVDPILTSKRIAIIDDVMTSGATANAFAKALKKSGASNVVVWALARTPKS